MSVQIIVHNNVPAFAVIPYDEYMKLLKAAPKNATDDLLIPNEVVGMMIEQKCSLIKAWRTHLGKTQKEVAEALGIGQSAFAQIEKSKSNQRTTLEKVAKVFGIEPEQLSLED